MVYFGKVHNGKIVLEPGAHLAEGATVRVEPVNGGPQAAAPPGAADPADHLDRFAVHTGIRDLATQHDRYCSGAPTTGSSGTGA